MPLGILRQYLKIFCQPRYLTAATMPDDSPILDCLAYGFAKLTEELQRGDDVILTAEQLFRVHALDARISQAANTRRAWNDTEWESTYLRAWELIEAMGWSDRISN